MALIPNNLLSLSESAIANVSLDALPHTFNFNANQQTLYLFNDTGLSFDINISGTGVTTFSCDGIEDQDVMSGRNITVPANSVVPVNTFSRRGYLGPAGNNVDVTLSSGTTNATSTVWTTSSA